MVEVALLPVAGAPHVAMQNLVAGSHCPRHEEPQDPSSSAAC